MHLTKFLAYYVKAILWYGIHLFFVFFDCEPKAIQIGWMSIHLMIISILIKLHKAVLK